MNRRANGGEVRACAGGGERDSFDRITGLTARQPAASATLAAGWRAVLNGTPTPPARSLNRPVHNMPVPIHFVPIHLPIHLVHNMPVPIHS